MLLGVILALENDPWKGRDKEKERNEPIYQHCLDEIESKEKEQLDIHNKTHKSSYIKLTENMLFSKLMGLIKDFE